MSTLPQSRSLALPLILLLIAGCAIAAVTNGVRTSLGLFTLPMTSDLGISRETLGFAMALQNLAWGAAQPFVGGLADRHGTARVLVAGLLLYALGLLLMTLSTTGPMLMLSAGLVTGVGIATSSFSIVMAAFGRQVPQEKRSLIFGVATAASSFGQFLFAPLGQALIGQFDWQTALIVFGTILIAVLPLSVALRGTTPQTPGRADLAPLEAIRRAWGFRSYRLLVIGFFVCGFHLAFINVHMPAYLVQCGLSPSVGGWAIAVIGLFNIVGSLASGYLGGRLPKQMLLASIYFARAVAIGLFVLLPANEVTTYIFAAAMGLLWLSTVPLTAGLVSQFFGARYMGMLYGLAFFSHQLGSFSGVWLGGYVYDHTGSYALVWYLGILLGLGSAALHLPIRERPAESFAAAATAGA